MKTITLEFSKLQLKKKRERWHLYFVLVTEHPDDNEKMLLTTFPNPYILLKPNAANLINFEPDGSPGADGYFVIVLPLPNDKRVKVRVYLYQSRKKVRNLGTALMDLKTSMGGDAFEIVIDLMGSSMPWLVAAKKVFPMIGTILSKLKDRNMGFVTMDESFDDEFKNINEVVRHNYFSTAEAEIWWKWKIRNS